MSGVVGETQWSQLSEFVAEKMGLHFPSDRRDDLQRGLLAAARELGFQDPACLLLHSLTTEQLQVVASHLTIGETYFFRDGPAMTALAQTVLPELIRRRRGRAQRLRIWSAGCCTGEEPYSLAILLQEALPDLRDWQVSITATDINPRFLEKAKAGVYSEWSFRGAPAGFRERHFQRTPDGRFAIAPRLRQMVNFSHLNLAQDAYPSPATDASGLDIILCRNVLMYFTPSQICKVAGRFSQALNHGGWLLVGASETSQTAFREFAQVSLPGAFVYRKGNSVTATSTRLTPGLAADPVFDAVPSPRAGQAQEHRREIRYAAPAATLPAAVGSGPAESEGVAALARALANEGKHDEALIWCDRWITADKLDAAAHYLRATVVLEKGNSEQARSSLQRAIYLQPDFVLAHFALGNLARLCGKKIEARKHFSNARHFLKRHPAGHPLPESDGLAAATFALTLDSIAGPATANE